jgi:thiamine-monophosphate kinase
MVLMTGMLPPFGPATSAVIMGQTRVVAGFSEDELVETIRKILSGDAPGVRLGPGDDAALVEFGPHLGVLTADMLVEDVHFDLGMVSPRDLGYKAVVSNLSDVAAMGGSPRYALVSLALPPDIEAAWVVELYGGVREAADEHGVAVVGGDLSRSGLVVVSVALTGEVAAGGAVTRSGARPGDHVVVTGTLGAAAGGLRLSQAEPGEARATAGTDWARALLAAYHRPVARVAEGETLARSGATAMMDVSDGLAMDLFRLCRESGVGAAIRLTDVPVAPDLWELVRVVPDVDPHVMALAGGEDFELLATLPEWAVEGAAERLRDRFGTALTDVGDIRQEPALLAVEPDGTERPMEPRGWDHFAS